jgi:hypothetical protein
MMRVLMGAEGGKTFLFKRGSDRLRDYGRYDRRRMIEETGEFLTWALREGRELPRIPRRRVDRGGFSELLRRPLARVIVAHWWRRVLEPIAPSNKLDN